MLFELVSSFSPAGDQPQAIESLTRGIQDNIKHQTLLGVTGSGKTYTLANVIASVNKPTLVIAHNKTLAAQLCNEFKEFFPNNMVEYFISYYDYYQPEAYLPSRDIYIEKEAEINEEIERLRHSATRSLLQRRDIIIVASVSCIYGLGLPEDYLKGVITLVKGKPVNRRQFLLNLQRIRYERHEGDLKRGQYRIKGDTIDLYPSWSESLLRLEFFGDELEVLSDIHPVSGDQICAHNTYDIFPATHYVINQSMDHAIQQIRHELSTTISHFEKVNKPLEAHRIKQRTEFDLEMMKEIGYCKGIENYSRHLSGKPSGAPPGVLLDFFPDDFLTIIDESHVTLPQIRGMYNGDRARKSVLVDFGFRLPSAKDNRPLTFQEAEQKFNQCIYVSATPGPYEIEQCENPNSPGKGQQIVEQIIRPTGLLDPQIILHKTQHQMDHLITEIRKRVDSKERVMVTTLTKQTSEDVCDFLSNKDIKVSYLHSEIHSLERLDILHNLRRGIFDVLIGVNLLREGLDIPEVSLVAILDADKEGFLRNERSLIQTMGRAARHEKGTVILYADTVTKSMSKAINETKRRRHLQDSYNKKHGITPKTIIKDIKDIRSEDRQKIKQVLIEKESLSPKKLPKLLTRLEADMKHAAENLEFELAAVLRDQIEELKQMDLKTLK